MGNLDVVEGAASPCAACESREVVDPNAGLRDMAAAAISGCNGAVIVSDDFGNKSVTGTGLPHGDDNRELRTTAIFT